MLCVMVGNGKGKLHENGLEARQNNFSWLPWIQRQLPFALCGKSHMLCFFHPHTKNENKDYNKDTILSK